MKYSFAMQMDHCNKQSHLAEGVADEEIRRCGTKKGL